MSTDPPKGGESFAALFEKEARAPRVRQPRVGDVLEAKVVQIGKETVFVELDGKRQAYLEAAELRAPDGTTSIAVGDVLRARVVEIEPDTGNVRLGDVATDVRLSVGAVVTGAVSRIEAFGVFLQIDGTSGRDGRGLIPLAELGVPRGTDLRKKFPEGTKLTAKVLDLAGGKMRLSLRAMKDDEERKQFEGFKKEAAPAPGKMGTLGDLLMKASTKKR
jgi:small subunit ribosomal protein S1